jgi:hypothetical protein
MGRGGGATTGVDTLLVVLHTRFDELPAALLLGARHILCYTAGAAKLSRQSCKEVLSELQSCFIGAANLSCQSCKRSCKVVSPELHAAKVGAAKVSRWSCKSVSPELQSYAAKAASSEHRRCQLRLHAASSPSSAIMMLQARRRALRRFCKPTILPYRRTEWFLAEAACSRNGSNSVNLQDHVLQFTAAAVQLLQWRFGKDERGEAEAGSS